jgi:hypothetical protein
LAGDGRQGSIRPPVRPLRCRRVLDVGPVPGPRERPPKTQKSAR